MSNAVASMKPTWTADLRSLLPDWMQREVGFKFLWSMALLGDIELENTLQSINDWAPGSPNSSPTALPLIAQSRGVLQGELEPDAAFAQRLIAWRETGKRAGQSEELGKQLLRYTGATRVRIIEKGPMGDLTHHGPQATYVTVNSDLTTSTVFGATWDWDHTSGGFDDTTIFGGFTAQTYWADMWIVIYPPSWRWLPSGSVIPDLAAIWGRTDIGLGFAMPTRTRDAILRIVAQYKGQHSFVRSIVVCTNLSLFDPAHPYPFVTGNPDGRWGFWGNGSVPARNTTGSVRYIQPRRGGN